MNAFSESGIDLVGVGLTVITDWRSQSSLLLIYRYISGEALYAPLHMPDGNTTAGPQITVKLHQLCTLNYMYIKLVTAVLEMSPVTSMFTFSQPCLQGLANILVYPLDLSVVYLNENVEGSQSN